jgi:TonB family protein
VKNCRINVLALFSALIAVMMFVPRVSSKPNKESTTKLVEFYVVDVGDVDYYPYWESEIVHVTKQADVAELEYTYIALATGPCNAPAIRGRAVSLQRTTSGALTNGLNLCAIDAEKFNRDAERYAKRPEAFHTLRSAVVAVCGEKVSVFKMPKFEMNEKLLKQKEPSAERMSQLLDYLKAKVLPSESQDASLSDFPADSLQMQALKDGRFDRGYWFGLQEPYPVIPAQVATSFDPTIGGDSDLGKLRNVLARYKHPNAEKFARTGTLVDSQGYAIKHFVPPVYPRLAVQTQIQGRVTLSLKVNQVTGQVENAEVSSGHPLLVQSAVDNAKLWQFEPSQKLPGKITATLDFSFHCDN